MSFNGALGDVQIASDFGVIASLQQKIDDLLFAGTHLAELLFHNTFTSQKPHRNRKSGETGARKQLNSGHFCMKECACTQPIGGAEVKKV